MNGIKFFINGMKKTCWLVCQIYPVSLGGIMFGVLSYQDDPWLLLLLFSPISIHLWSGFLYGADRYKRPVSWRSWVILWLALLQIPIVAVAIMTTPPELDDFIWLYGFFSIAWSFAAWLIGGMAIVDDWM